MCDRLKLAKDRQLKVGDPLPLKGDMYPGRHEPDGARDLQRPHQDRPADVPVPLRLPRRGPEEGHHGAARGLAGPPERQAVGQRRHDLHQVQERRHHALAGQEDRRPLSQQRLPDSDPDRGSLRQDVRRDAGRPQGTPSTASAWPSSSRSCSSRATPWRWRCASGPPRWPCSRPSASARGWCCSWS